MSRRTTIKAINAAISPLGQEAFYDRAGCYVYFMPIEGGLHVRSIYAVNKLSDVTVADVEGHVRDELQITGAL